MNEKREIGAVPNTAAGDEESGKHPANDAVIGGAGAAGVNQPRDREAQLSKDAGDRPRAVPDADEATDQPHTKRPSGPE